MFACGTTGEEKALTNAVVPLQDTFGTLDILWQMDPSVNVVLRIFIIHIVFGPSFLRGKLEQVFIQAFLRQRCGQTVPFAKSHLCNQRGH